MRKNIFIIGDLVVDHAIQVREHWGPHQAVEGEITHAVVRRQDTAGGAANSARALAVLNEGSTYLWGVLGRSHWGTFRDILASSHLLDGATNDVQLRGVQDETAAYMNTITRVLLVHEDGTVERIARFDDVDHVHVSEHRRRDALKYSLERVHDTKHPLDAILINDLDKRCLTRRMVEDVFEFAIDKKIPVLVDPKREREKYAGLRGTAVLPNLEEWCHLVDDTGQAQKWRDNIDDSRMLERMAHRSFRYLGNFTCHIITCDKLGAVIIAPHPKRSHMYAVYRAKPVAAKSSPIAHPLGCGDVLSGVIAAELDRKEQLTESILRAFHRANVAVACYREMSWHRMPDKRLVEERISENDSWSPSPEVEPTMGLLYLPHNKVIHVTEARTEIPGFLSKDETCRTAIAGLVAELASLESVGTRSVILAAPSGHGKSVIMSAFQNKIGPRINMDVRVETKSFAEWNGKDAGEYFSRLAGDTRMGPRLVIIDEAYSNKTVFASKELLSLLEQCSDNGIRFLFIDSHFCRTHQSQALDSMISDIRSRCRFIELSPISDRPIDIKFLVAGALLAIAQRYGFESVQIEGQALLMAIDGVLRTGNPRSLLHAIGKAFEQGCKASQHKSPRLRSSDVPEFEGAGSTLVADLVPEWFDVIA